MDSAELRVRARSLDARREQLAADYEELLTDLRDAVANGNRHLDPDGMLDQRVDRASFWLFAIEPVFARAAAPHVASKDSEPARWWHTDIDEGTHMDLRRWLDRCLRDGLFVLGLSDFPASIRETEGDRLLSASDGRRPSTAGRGRSSRLTPTLSLGMAPAHIGDMPAAGPLQAVAYPELRGPASPGWPQRRRAALMYARRA